MHAQTLDHTTNDTYLDHVTNTDDYPMTHHTAHMLRTYRDGDDIMLRHGEPAGEPHLDTLVRYLRDLPNRDKGETIIDLLTLVDALRHTILTLQTNAMTGLD